MEDEFNTADGRSVACKEYMPCLISFVQEWVDVITDIAHGITPDQHVVVSLIFKLWNHEFPLEGSTYLYSVGEAKVKFSGFSLNQ